MKDDAIYVMDRGYIDFSRLYSLHQAGAFFVTLAKTNMNYLHVSSRSVDMTSGLFSDQSIMLDGFYAPQNYSKHLKCINFCDQETKKKLIFLTNNFTLPALTISNHYKQRWNIELFPFVDRQ